MENFTFERNQNNTEVTVFKNGEPVYRGGMHPAMDMKDYGNLCLYYAQNIMRVLRQP